MNFLIQQDQNSNKANIRQDFAFLGKIPELAIYDTVDIDLSDKQKIKS